MGVTAKGRQFAADLRGHVKICLDSSIIIYHLEDMKPYSDLTAILLERLAAGAATGVLSTISLTELLVKPFADGRLDRVAVLESFVATFPHLAVVPPSASIATQAARLRAAHGLRVPDALICATALAEKASAFLTDDIPLRKVKVEGIAVLVLDDYL
ncbi:MAG: PIN domain-containing protein [Planctomycetes bacterium]|nr:PIN domain-containing protein [Planctomycetota bacterium]